MEYVHEVTLGILTSALSFLLGYGVRRVVQRVRSLQTHRFWRPFTDSPTTLVIGRFEKFLDFEPSGLVGMGDARALHQLVEDFDDAGLRRFKIAYANSLRPEQLEGNLILFGASDANRAADLLMKRMRAQVEFLDDNISLRDNISNTTFRPEQLDGLAVTDFANGPIAKDYGVLIRARNPLRRENWIVIVAGCFGFATWAGVRLISSDGLVRLSSGVEQFLCIYCTEVVDDAPAHTSVVAFREMP